MNFLDVEIRSPRDGRLWCLVRRECSIKLPLRNRVGPVKLGSTRPWQEGSHGYPADRSPAVGIRRDLDFGRRRLPGGADRFDLLCRCRYRRGLAVKGVCEPDERSAPGSRVSLGASAIRRYHLFDPGYGRAAMRDSLRETVAMPSAIELATLLRDFVDVLSPGSRRVWPAASVVGGPGRCWRCACSRGCAASGVPLGSSRRHCSPRGGPLAPLDAAAAAGWSSASRRACPQLFCSGPQHQLRRLLRESGGRQGSSRGLGQPYRAMPGSKDGYPMAPFDLVRDRPTPRARRLCAHRRCPRQLDLGQLHGRRAWRHVRSPPTS